MFVQSAAGIGTTNATATLNGVGQGHPIIACVQASAAVGATFVVSDPVNGSYSPAVSYNVSSGHIPCAILFFPSSASGSIAVKATMSPAGSTVRIVAMEFNDFLIGLDPNGIAVGFSTVNSLALSSGNCGTLAQAKNLAIGFGVTINSETYVAGSGFTLDPNTANPIRMDEYQELTSNAPLAATFSVSGGGATAWDCLLAVFNVVPPSAFVNDAQGSQTGLATSVQTAAAISVTAKNSLLVAARYANAAQQTVTMSDTVGGNTYLPMATYFNAASGSGAAFFYVLSAAAGSALFTASVGSSSNNMGVYVGQYSNIGAFLAAVGQENESPGTGADAYTSGNVNASQVPALVWSFVAPIHNFNNAPVAGSGFTGRTPCWLLGGAVNLALAEDQRILVPGNVAGTFTINEASGRYVLVAVFPEPVVTLPSAGGASLRGVQPGLVPRSNNLIMPDSA